MDWKRILSKLATQLLWLHHEKKYLSWLLIQGSSLCAIFPGKYVFNVAQLAIIEIVSLWIITLYSFWITLAGGNIDYNNC